MSDVSDIFETTDYPEFLGYYPFRKSITYTP